MQVLFFEEILTPKELLVNLNHEVLPKIFLPKIAGYLVDYVLFLKERYIEEDITKEEEINILQSLKDYEAGDYLTLEEYEVSQQ